MGGILAVLIGLIAITFIPVFFLGWILKGWRPYLVSLFALAAFIWLAPNVNFHPIASIIHYFVVVGLYALGGKVRTGKSTEEVLSGKPKEESDVPV